MQKARLLHADLGKKLPGTSAAVSEAAEAGSTNLKSKLAYTV